MRASLVWVILAGICLLGAWILELFAWADFHASLSARIDRAQMLEGNIVRPAAAARLTAVLLEHRLTLVSETDAKAVAGAFSRTPAREAIEAYRRAGGNAAVLVAAQRALAAGSSSDADGEVALLRAVRLLREESSKAPSPARPEPPSSAGRAAGRLLWAGGAAALAALCAFAAGRARSTSASA